MTYDDILKAVVVVLVVPTVLIVGTALLLSDSAEVSSYNWAKTFCGGKDTDISDYQYIMRGNVVCKDGREASVPL